MVKEAIMHDELKLKVVMTKNGRVVIPEDEAKLKFVSKCGGKYYDRTWRVNALTAKQFSSGVYHPKLKITYCDHNAEKAGKNRLKWYHDFHTGHVKIWLEDFQDGEGVMRSQMKCEAEDYQEILVNRFGIRDGYEFTSPNTIWSSEGEKEVFIFSDGMVKLADSGYQAMDATWVVVYDYDPRMVHTAGIRLYTDSEKFDDLLADLEAFLEEHEMSNFEDLLLRLT